jgi:hypothetical protein
LSIGVTKAMVTDTLLIVCIAFNEYKAVFGMNKQEAIKRFTDI